jgi:hypothetical protein
MHDITEYQYQQLRNRYPNDEVLRDEINKQVQTRDYNEEDVKVEAIGILEQAIAWIREEGEKPQSHNLDAVARVVRALELCGIG